MIKLKFNMLKLSILDILHKRASSAMTSPQAQKTINSGLARESNSCSFLNVFDCNAIISLSHA